MRTYEAIAGGFHERAVHTVTKAQAAIEAAAAGKVAAVAASAAAVAGGGYATVERTVGHRYANQAPKTVAPESERASKPTVAARHVSVAPARSVAKPAAQAVRRVNEFGHAQGGAGSAGPTEFDQAPRRDSFRTISAAATSPARKPPARSAKPRAAPEFGSADAGGEFGP
jgi:hypothetical protein